MTRLRGEWMKALIENIDACEKDMLIKTGLDFAGLAAASNGLTREFIRDGAKKHSVAVIRITQGEGVISDFAESVAAIIVRAGFSSFVADDADVSGIYEAYERGASIAFMADDARYIGMRLDVKRLCDNNECTARAYTTLLEHAAGSLAGRSALVAGCGVIGREAGKCLVAKGANTVYYDSDEARLNAMQARGFEVRRDVKCLMDFDLVFDATNTGGWLHEGMLRRDAWVAAPGVPLSLDRGALEAYGARVLHDDLESGTLAMLGGLV